MKNKNITDQERLMTEVKLIIEDYYKKCKKEFYEAKNC